MTNAGLITRFNRDAEADESGEINDEKCSEIQTQFRDLFGKLRQNDEKRQAVSRRRRAG